MSYASTAAHNAPPPSQQPHPDPALLNTTPPTHDNVVHDSTKVNIVAPDFKQNLYSSESPRAVFGEDEEDEFPAIPGDKPRKAKAKKRVQQAEAEGLQLWETAKHYLVRPGVAGGLIGVGM